jgi:hypothetical protein
VVGEIQGRTIADETAKDLVRIKNTGGGNTLSTAQFGALAEMPAELGWLANITNPKTKRAYKIDVEEFIAFAGLRGPADLRTVTHAHVIAWRKNLERGANSRTPPSGASSRRSPPCSIISASATLSPATRSTE